MSNSATTKVMILCVDFLSGLKKDLGNAGENPVDLDVFLSPKRF